MKFIKHIFLRISLLTLLPMAMDASKNSISYTCERVGRFGDCLLGYSEARWLSFIHGYDFYYAPFTYSDELAMSIKLQHRTEHTFKKEVTISDANQIDHNKSGIIYIGDGFLANNHIDFENNEFVELLRSEIWPIIPIDKINLPEDHYTVALHVRRGGGYDHQLYQKDTIVNIRSKYADRNYPKRFPPDSFYIDQLKYVAALHADKKIYVHIFTDDPKPSTIAKKIETAVGNPRLTFGYRTKANRHDKNVLTDFFNMMNFDCLIRADSNYSEMAGSIGRLSLEIAPAEHFWHGKELSITEKKLISRTEGKTVIEYEKK